MRRTNQDAFSDELNGIKSPVLGGLDRVIHVIIIESEKIAIGCFSTVQLNKKPQPASLDSSMLT